MLDVSCLDSIFVFRNSKHEHTIRLVWIGPNVERSNADARVESVGETRSGNTTETNYLRAAPTAMWPMPPESFMRSVLTTSHEHHVYLQSRIASRCTRRAKTPLGFRSRGERGRRRRRLPHTAAQCRHALIDLQSPSPPRAQPRARRAGPAETAGAGVRL